MPAQGRTGTLSAPCGLHQTSATAHGTSTQPGPTALSSAPPALHVPSPTRSALGSPAPGVTVGQLTTLGTRWTEPQTPGTGSAGAVSQQSTTHAAWVSLAAPRDGPPPTWLGQRHHAGEVAA